MPFRTGRTGNTTNPGMTPIDNIHEDIGIGRRYEPDRTTGTMPKGSEDDSAAEEKKGAAKKKAARRK